MTGRRKSAIIEPSRSALVIIDMQEFFLNPELTPSAEGGRKAVQPTLNMIQAFRAKGMKVLWVNWGLDQRDLRDMPPALLVGFSDDGGPLSKLSPIII
jgi:nicotinamidase-related amidase